jgi:hypothetical protein
MSRSFWEEAAELESFKRDIDLRQFALSIGYAADRRESWRGSTVLRRGGDKIVVKRNSNSHYVFFSVRDEGDHGTIIDFVQRRHGASLGEVRRLLRPWIGASAVGKSIWSPLEPTGKNRMRVESQFRRVEFPSRHPYLEDERGLSAAVLSGWRFRERIGMDERGNVVFPHFDQQGLCGYEIKNRGFTGFAPGGEKGLWCSRSREEDHRLVLSESAVDALSYAALLPDAEDRTRYASLAGKPSAKQLSLIHACAKRLPERSEIVAAFDADETGLWLVKTVGKALATVPKITLKVHLPAEPGADWNDVLRASQNQTKGGSST